MVITCMCTCICCCCKAIDLWGPKVVTFSEIRTPHECLSFPSTYTHSTYTHDARWLEAVLQMPLPPVTELECALQNGVILCRLGMRLLPDDPMWTKVYDIDENKFKVSLTTQTNAWMYTNTKNLLSLSLPSSNPPFLCLSLFLPPSLLSPSSLHPSSPSLAPPAEERS